MENKKNNKKKEKQKRGGKKRGPLRLRRRKKKKETILPTSRITRLDPNNTRVTASFASIILRSPFRP
ncbi:hypothetical protein L249_6365, partial [Ophiocordyceps polyrhachis-furcata BCC 54312]